MRQDEQSSRNSSFSLVCNQKEPVKCNLEALECLVSDPNPPMSTAVMAVSSEGQPRDCGTSNRVG